MSRLNLCGTVCPAHTRRRHALRGQDELCDQVFVFDMDLDDRRPVRSRLVVSKATSILAASRMGTKTRRMDIELSQRPTRSVTIVRGRWRAERW